MKTKSLLKDPKEKKCKYCLPNLEGQYLLDKRIEIGSGLAALEVVVDTNQRAIAICLTEFIEGTFPIKYCPMCGREL